MANLVQKIINKSGYYLRQMRNLVGDSRQLWDAGLAEEIAFWEDVITNPDNPHHESIVNLSNPQRPFNETVIELLAAPAGSMIEILDIGAGPVTQLGYIWEGRTVRVHPTDALAEHYNRFLAQAGFTPPFPTVECHAEAIETMFQPETFDLIYSRNALDHTYNPMQALHQSMRLLKPGGWIYLSHAVNEGKRVYNGLHQWNFDQQDGEFVVWKMGERHIVSAELTGIAEMRCERYQMNKKPFIDVFIRKERHP